MNPRDLKLLYNITVWHRHEINFWGIPKCANTSVKFSLLGHYPKDEHKIGKEVHSFRYSRYISRTIALRNSYQNVTVTRHPYDRVKSLYQDFVLRRPNPLTQDCHDFDSFLDQVILKTDDSTSTNIHFRSQCYFIACSNYESLYPVDVYDIKEIDKLFQRYSLKGVKSNVTESLGIDLTLDQKNKIYQRYCPDFKLLNYSK